jgi:flagellar motor switch protein FliN
MSDILSQDQIDALLNSQGFGEKSDTGISINDPNSLYPLLIKIFDVFCEQASTVISTVLNRKVTYHTELCEQGSIDTIHEKMPSVLLSLKIPLKSIINGQFYLIIQKKNVAILSDLMMMGDGNAEYTEDHKDAIGEMFNQVMGAFTNTLTSDWNLTVTSETIVVDEFDTEHPSIDLASCGMILITQNVDQMPESFVTLLIPKELSEQFIEKGKAFYDSGVEGASSSGIAENVGLNMSELDDLSRVTSYSESPSGASFQETPLVSSRSNAPPQNIDMLMDIDLDVSIELGNSMLSIKRILELAPGSIVELDRMAGEPVDLLVNNKVVAKGEVVVIDENFGIRIVSLVSTEERIRSLR